MKLGTTAGLIAVAILATACHGTTRNSSKHAQVTFPDKLEISVVKGAPISADQAQRIRDNFGKLKILDILEASFAPESLDADQKAKQQQTLASATDDQKQILADLKTKCEIKNPTEVTNGKLEQRINSSQSINKTASIKGANCAVESSSNTSMQITLVEYYKATSHALYIMSGTVDQKNLIKDQALMTKSGLLSLNLGGSFFGGSKIDGGIDKNHLEGSFSGTIILADNTNIPFTAKMEKIENKNQSSGLKISQTLKTFEFNYSGLRITYQAAINKKNDVVENLYYINGQTMTAQQVVDFFGGVDFVGAKDQNLKLK